MQDGDAETKNDDPELAAELERMKKDTTAGFLRPSRVSTTWPHDGEHYVGRRSILFRSSHHDD